MPRRRRLLPGSAILLTLLCSLTLAAATVSVTRRHDTTRERLPAHHFTEGEGDRSSSSEREERPRIRISQQDREALRRRFGSSYTDEQIIAALVHRERARSARARLEKLSSASRRRHPQSPPHPPGMTPVPHSKPPPNSTALVVKQTRQPPQRRQIARLRQKLFGVLRRSAPISEDAKTALALQTISDEETYLGTGTVQGINVGCLPDGTPIEIVPHDRAPGYGPAKPASLTAISSSPLASGVEMPPEELSPALVHSAYQPEGESVKMSHFYTAPKGGVNFELDGSPSYPEMPHPPPYSKGGSNGGSSGPQEKPIAFPGSISTEIAGTSAMKGGSPSASDFLASAGYDFGVFEEGPVPPASSSSTARLPESSHVSSTASAVSSATTPYASSNVDSSYGRDGSTANARPAVVTPTAITASHHGHGGLGGNGYISSSGTTASPIGVSISYPEGSSYYPGPGSGGAQHQVDSFASTTAPSTARPAYSSSMTASPPTYTSSHGAYQGHGASSSSSWKGGGLPASSSSNVGYALPMIDANSDGRGSAGRYPSSRGEARKPPYYFGSTASSSGSPVYQSSTPPYSSQTSSNFMKPQYSSSSRSPPVTNSNSSPSSTISYPGSSYVSSTPSYSSYPYPSSPSNPHQRTTKARLESHAPSQYTGGADSNEPSAHHSTHYNYHPSTRKPQPELHATSQSSPITTTTQSSAQRRTSYNYHPSTLQPQKGLYTPTPSSHAPYSWPPGPTSVVDTQPESHDYDGYGAYPPSSGTTESPMIASVSYPEGSSYYPGPSGVGLRHQVGSPSNPQHESRGTDSNESSTDTRTPKPQQESSTQSSTPKASFTSHSRPIVVTTAPLTGTQPESQVYSAYGRDGGCGYPDSSGTSEFPNGASISCPEGNSYNTGHDSNGYHRQLDSSSQPHHESYSTSQTSRGTDSNESSTHRSTSHYYQFGSSSKPHHERYFPAPSTHGTISDDSPANPSTLNPLNNLYSSSTSATRKPSSTPYSRSVEFTTTFTTDRQLKEKVYNGFGRDCGTESPMGAWIHNLDGSSYYRPTCAEEPQHHIDSSSKPRHQYYSTYPPSSGTDENEPLLPLRSSPSPHLSTSKREHEHFSQTSVGPAHVADSQGYTGYSENRDDASRIVTESSTTDSISSPKGSSYNPGPKTGGERSTVHYSHPADSNPWRGPHSHSQSSRLIDSKDPNPHRSIYVSPDSPPAGVTSATDSHGNSGNEGNRGGDYRISNTATGSHTASISYPEASTYPQPKSAGLHYHMPPKPQNDLNPLPQLSRGTDSGEASGHRSTSHFSHPSTLRPYGESYLSSHPLRGTNARETQQEAYYSSQSSNGETPQEPYSQPAGITPSSESRRYTGIGGNSGADNHASSAVTASIVAASISYPEGSSYYPGPEAGGDGSTAHYSHPSASRTQQEPYSNFQPSHETEMNGPQSSYQRNSRPEHASSVSKRTSSQTPDSGPKGVTSSKEYQGSSGYGWKNAASSHTTASPVVAAISYPEGSSYYPGPESGGARNNSNRFLEHQGKYHNSHGSTTMQADLNASMQPSLRTDTNEASTQASSQSSYPGTTKAQQQSFASSQSTDRTASYRYPSLAGVTTDSSLLYSLSTNSGSLGYSSTEAPFKQSRTHQGSQLSYSTTSKSESQPTHTHSKHPTTKSSNVPSDYNVPTTNSPSNAPSTSPSATDASYSSTTTQEYRPSSTPAYPTSAATYPSSSSSAYSASRSYSQSPEPSRSGVPSTAYPGIPAGRNVVSSMSSGTEDGYDIGTGSESVSQASIVTYTESPSSMPSFYSSQGVTQSSSSAPPNDLNPIPQRSRGTDSVDASGHRSTSHFSHPSTLRPDSQANTVTYTESPSSMPSFYSSQGVSQSTSSAPYSNRPLDGDGDYGRERPSIDQSGTSGQYSKGYAVGHETTTEPSPSRSYSVDGDGASSSGYYSSSNSGFTTRSGSSISNGNFGSVSTATLPTVDQEGKSSSPGRYQGGGYPSSSYSKESDKNTNSGHYSSSGGVNMGGSSGGTGRHGNYGSGTRTSPPYVDQRGHPSGYEASTVSSPSSKDIDRESTSGHHTSSSGSYTTVGSGGHSGSSSAVSPYTSSQNGATESSTGTSYSTPFEATTQGGFSNGQRSSATYSNRGSAGDPHGSSGSSTDYSGSSPRPTGSSFGQSGPPQGSSSSSTGLSSASSESYKSSTGYSGTHSGTSSSPHLPFSGPPFGSSSSSSRFSGPSAGPSSGSISSSRGLTGNSVETSSPDTGYSMSFAGSSTSSSIPSGSSSGYYGSSPESLSSSTGYAGSSSGSYTTDNGYGSSTTVAPSKTYTGSSAAFSSTSASNTQPSTYPPWQSTVPGGAVSSTPSYETSSAQPDKYSTTPDSFVSSSQSYSSSRPGGRYTESQAAFSASSTSSYPTESPYTEVPSTTREGAYSSVGGYQSTTPSSLTSVGVGGFSSSEEAGGGSVHVYPLPRPGGGGSSSTRTQQQVMPSGNVYEGRHGGRHSTAAPHQPHTTSSPYDFVSSSPSSNGDGDFSSGLGPERGSSYSSGMTGSGFPASSSHGSGHGGSSPHSGGIEESIYLPAGPSGSYLTATTFEQGSSPGTNSGSAGSSFLPRPGASGAPEGSSHGSGQPAGEGGAIYSTGGGSNAGASVPRSYGSNRGGGGHHGGSHGSSSTGEQGPSSGVISPGSSTGFPFLPTLPKGEHYPRPSPKNDGEVSGPRPEAAGARYPILVPPSAQQIKETEYELPLRPVPLRPVSTSLTMPGAPRPPPWYVQPQQPPSYSIAPSYRGLPPPPQPPHPVFPQQPSLSFYQPPPAQPFWQPPPPPLQPAAGCCGGSFFAQGGGLCAPISYAPCGCGSSCQPAMFTPCCSNPCATSCSPCNNPCSQSWCRKRAKRLKRLHL